MDEVNWDFNAPTHIDFASNEHNNSENIEEIEDYFSKYDFMTSNYIINKAHCKNCIN